MFLQEFEDWDDVGLNVPRPASLISLFWGSTSTVTIPKTDTATQTDLLYANNECQTDFDEGNVCVSCQTSLDNDTDWNHEVINMHLPLFVNKIYYVFIFVK